MKKCEAVCEQITLLEAALASRVLGQGSAIGDIGAWGSAWLAGLLERAPRILLLGPTGVGKTASAEALSLALTGQPPLRFDMSEFCEPQATRWWLGDRAGDLGRLAPRVRPGERTVLLLDEIEKAHSNVVDLLLPMLEPGHLSLANGDKVDLSQVLIICTSNVASAALVDVYEVSKSAQVEHVQTQAKKELRPELLNRFDAMVVFHPLELEHQQAVLNLHLESYLRWLLARGYRLASSPAVERFLLMRGFDRQYGARPLRRTLRRLIGDAIIDALKQLRSGSGTLAVSKDRLVIES